MDTAFFLQIIHFSAPAFVICLHRKLSNRRLVLPFSFLLTFSVLPIYMLGSSVASPYFPSTQSLLTYPIFAFGFLLTTENVGVSILLTAFLTEAHELPAHLLLRTQIGVFGVLGSAVHAIIMVSWAFLVLYAALKLQPVKLNQRSALIMAVAFAGIFTVYFVDPTVDLSTSMLYVFKRVWWFACLSVLVKSP